MKTITITCNTCKREISGLDEFVSIEVDDKTSIKIKNTILKDRKIISSGDTSFHWCSKECLEKFFFYKPDELK